jgi:hypothetical protein
MAKTKISEWSSTPASNSDIDGINLAEGMVPSDVNNAIREMMSQIKDLQSANGTYYTADSDAIAIGAGGTGAITASAARTNLAVLGTSNNLSDVASASTARTNLGLAIGTDVQAYNSDLQGISQGGNSCFKNRIINGGMVIDQRNAGAVVTLTSTFPVDRFYIIMSAAGKFTAQQNAGAVTPPSGFSNYLGTTSTSAYTAGASEIFGINHRVEGLNTADLGWGTASASAVTLSFWVRSSLTGTFGGAFYNSGNTRSYPFSYTISAANTWEQKTVTIAGDTSGTWLATNGVGLGINFSIGAGATVSGTSGAWAGATYWSATGATSVVGTNGATFYITGVQLEKGSTATSFDYRPYGTELALCQRYYEKSYNDGTAIGTATTVGVVGQSGLQGVTTTTEAGTYVTFKVTKRATPTISVWDGNGNSNKLDRIQAGVTNNYNSTFSGTANLGANGFVGFSGSGATCTSVQFHYAASSEL